MARVLVPLAQGFEEIEAVTVIDVMRRGGVETVTASIDGGGLDVLAAHGVVMRADARFLDVADENYDAIVLPGGGEGTARLREYEPLAERLARQKAEGGLICAICAAPTILTDLELVDEDLHVTCYPSCAPDLDRRCANAPVVADGQFITGQAPGSAMLFALVVLSALAGDRIARKVAAGLVTDVLD